MMRTTFGLALLASTVIGCASNKDMGPVHASLSKTNLVSPEQAKQLEKAMTDQDIAMMLDARVKAKLPANLAVAKLQDSYGLNYGPRYGRYGRHDSLELTAITAEEMQGWERASAGEKLIQSVRAMSPVSHEGSKLDLHSLRAAAARMNCELLLVYLQADGAVDNYNDAAAMYWTIVGLWVAPGNTYQRKTVMQAALVDCRTGMILGTANGAGELKTSYAAAYGDIAKPKLDNQTPDLAIKELQKNSSRMIQNVVIDAQKN